MTKSISRNKNGKITNFSSGYDYKFFKGTGGSGGFICTEPASFSHIFWGVDVPNESTRNIKLHLYNKNFAPYTATETGICPYNNDVKQDMTLYVFYEKPTVMDASIAVASKFIPATLTFPYKIVLNEWELPQPSHQHYEDVIWLALDLGSTGLMVNNIPQEFPALRAISLNWEGDL